MSPTNFPLRWESTGDQWWYASPIDWAAANGHYDLVRELLRIDGNHLIKLTSLRRIRRLESVWDNEEQFHDVAKCRSEVARKLLFQCDTKKGNNSLIQAGYGGWLIYTAASAGDLGFVRNLLDRNPLLVFGEGEFGVTDILYAAARSKNSEVFMLLFDFAASPRFTTGQGSEMEDHIGDVPSVYKWEMFNRAVHAAARGGNLKILKELLADCCDVLAYRDVQGSTILHTAAGRGQVEIVNYLIASFDIVNSTDHQGNTALHVAANRGQLAAVEALISASPSSVCSKNSTEETFLHKAVSGFQTISFRRVDKQIGLLKQLICGKIFNIQDIINAKNNDERTALHMAIIGNIHTDLVQLLMTAHSIDVNIRDANGMTPLDYLRQSPQSASSDILIRQLTSAGGIFCCQNYTARKVFASRLRMESSGSSPGTSFRISDQEIFLYTGMEQNVTSDASVEPCSSGLSSSSVEQSSCDSTNTTHIPSMSTKPSSVHYAAERMKRVFHWPKIKEKNTQKLKNSNVTPASLRTRFSNATSLPNNKRTLSVRSNQSSPTAKKKFASGLRRGVMQAIPHITVPGRSSRSSSFSKSLISSPTSLHKQKGIYIENDIAGPSCSNKVVDDDGTRNIVKQGYVNKKIKSQYLCFGKSGLSVNTPDSRQQLNQDYKRPFASVA